MNNMSHLNDFTTLAIGNRHFATDSDFSFIPLANVALCCIFTSPQTYRNILVIRYKRVDM